MHDFEEKCNIFRGVKAVADELVPYDIFPTTPGLFPWGGDNNGSTLFWLTECTAPEWPIFVAAARDDYFQRFDMSVTSFLTGCFTRTIKCYCWSDPAFFSGPEPVRFEKGW
jgi:hypothetical protein